MHNNDFEILLRSVHLSPKLQTPKIHKNIQNIKCSLYNTSWLYLNQNWQLYLGTSHLISPYLCK